MFIYNCVPTFVKLVHKLPASMRATLPAGSDWGAQLVMTSSQWQEEGDEEWMDCAEVDPEATTVAAATGIEAPNNIMIECLVGIAGQPVVKHHRSKLVVGAMLLLPNDLALHYRSDRQQPMLQWRTANIDCRTVRSTQVVRRTRAAVDGGRILWVMEHPQLLGISATIDTNTSPALKSELVAA